MNPISFRVYGLPQTKGSTRAFMPKGARFPIITNDNPKNKAWALVVHVAARAARDQRGMTEPLSGAVKLWLGFHMPKPKSLKKYAPMTKRPDLDKMVRSIKDALKGVFYLDDAQVVELHAMKFYSNDPGAEIEIRPIV